MSERTTSLETAEEFNAAHPIGTRVLAFPGSREGRAILTTTRSEAWRLGSGDPVVMVEGYAGGIALTHIEVMPDAPEATDPTCSATSPSSDWVPGIWDDHEHACVTHASTEHECACGARWGIEATDPTPGEVGMTMRLAVAYYTPRGWALDDGEDVDPDDLAECLRAMAPVATEVERILAARTADLRAEHAAEAEALQRDRDLALASAASMDHFSEVAERVERRNNELARERDEFREASEERAAAAEAAEAREAELRATDFTPVVAAHQRRLDPAGSCTCGGWPTEPCDVPWTDHLALALRAALTIPPTTEDGKR